MMLLLLANRIQPTYPLTCCTNFQRGNCSRNWWRKDLIRLTRLSNCDYNRSVLDNDQRRLVQDPKIDRLDQEIFVMSPIVENVSTEGIQPSEVLYPKRKLIIDEIKRKMGSHTDQMVNLV